MKSFPNNWFLSESKNIIGDVKGVKGIETDNRFKF